jgi:hypothetical protein
LTRMANIPVPESIDQRRLRAAADAYAAACEDYRRLADAAAAVYRRLEASPGTIEYQIEWSQARRAEAAAAARRARAERLHRAAGGYARRDEDHE